MSALYIWIACSIDHSINDNNIHVVGTTVTLKKEKMLPEQSKMHRKRSEPA